MRASTTTIELVTAKIKYTYLLDCWEWAGFKVTRGYGGLIIAKKQYLAHRVVYALMMGWNLDFSSEIIIRHKCDNTSCVNYAHLEHGSHSDNMQDRFKDYIPKTHCKWGHLKKGKSCSTCSKYYNKVKTGHWRYTSIFSKSNIEINPSNPPVEKTWIRNGRLYSNLE